MKVLIIDDDMHYRDLITPYLESYGFEVQEANDANTGLRMALRNKYDILIVDGALPDDNGLNVIRKIRDAGNQVPIVWASAWWKDEKTLARLANELGVRLALAKPIKPNDLCKEIVNLIGDPKQARAPSVEDEGASSQLSVSQKLEMAHRAFKHELPPLLHQIREKVTTSWKFPEQHIDLSDVIRHVHNLKGTAGMFGHISLGQLMETIETYLTDVQTGAQNLNETSWQEIEKALERAEDELTST